MTERLFELLLNSRNTLILTGAGISTLSGIPDFRSGNNGMCRAKWHGIELEEILSIDCFRHAPELFYEWAQGFIYSRKKYQPNIVHRVIAELEKQNMCSGIYTQNIDRLHQNAGSRKVYELHGSAESYHCIECGAKHSESETAPVIGAGQVPRCRICNGYVKPDIVFYGESLNEAIMEQAEQAFEHAELLLVLGSSLTVYPAADMPMVTLQGGGDLVIVNTQPTRFDKYAKLKLDDLKSVFEYLAIQLKMEQ